jgi:hypothetical protein
LDRVRRAPVNAAKRGVALLLGTVWVVATFPALAMAGLSVMASDSGVNAAVYAFIFACFALPVMTVAAATCCFAGAITGSRRKVLIGCVLPFAPVVLAFGVSALAGLFS